MYQDSRPEKTIAVIAPVRLRPAMGEIFAHSKGFRALFYDHADAALASPDQDRADVLVCINPEHNHFSYPIIAVFENGYGGNRGEFPRADTFSMPFRPGALLDRVAHHLDRHGDENRKDRMTIGSYALIPEDATLLDASGQTIRLTEKERDILLILHGEKGRTVPRKALLDAVWGYKDGVETHTLETHIYRLRKKIEDDPARPALLLTEETGYRLADL